MKRLAFLAAAFGAFFLFPGAFPNSRHVVLVHSNDIHGSYLPHLAVTAEGTKRRVGGMEAMSHYLEAMRRQDPHVIYLDAGDLMTGTLAAEWEYQGTAGGALIEFLNRLDCRVWCPGNHEFDLGKENLFRLVRLAEFPVVQCNVVDKNTGRLLVGEPYHVLCEGGIRVGFIGVMEEIFPVEIQRTRVEGLDVLPVIPTLRSLVPEVERRSDAVVVLYHGRFREGVQIAEEVPGVDAVIVASDEGKFREIKGIPVQSTFGHQKSLGFLRLEVEEGRVSGYSRKQVWLWADVPLRPSPSVASLVAEVREALGRKMDRVIGRSARDHIQKDRVSESSLGDWITDAMRWKTKAEIALHNSGGIRDNLLTGAITENDVFKVSPFRNTLVLFTLTGQQIKDLLEHDVDKGWDRLQVSGLKVIHYPKAEKPRGERVVHLEVNGEILVEDGKVLFPAKTFTVVSNDYLIGQAEAKYFGFSVPAYKDTGILLHQVLIEWLEEHRVLDYEVEGRILELKEGKGGKT